MSERTRQFFGSTGSSWLQPGGRRLILVYALCAIGTISCPHAKAEEKQTVNNSARQPQDGVRQTLDAYANAVREVQKQPFTSEKERRTFYQTWLDRFLNVVADNPKSPYLSVALAKALGLSNGLGQYEQSKTLLTALVEHNQQPDAQLRWLCELGELESNQYRASRSESAFHGAVAALEAADKLGSALAASDRPMNPDTRMRYVLSLTYLARILSDKRH